MRYKSLMAVVLGTAVHRLAELDAVSLDGTEIVELKTYPELSAEVTYTGPPMRNRSKGARKKNKSERWR